MLSVGRNMGCACWNRGYLKSPVHWEGPSVSINKEPSDKWKGLQELVNRVVL